jgi:FG-GAP-like repeat
MTLAILPLLLCTAPADDLRFELVGPRIMRLDWSTRAINAADIDGDRRIDLAIVNNDKAQIELLLQRTPDEIKKSEKRVVGTERWEPVLEDAPFLRQAVLVGDYVYDLELIDVNGDGKLDIVYTGKRDRVAARLQNDAGEFEEEWSYDKEEPSANVGSIAAADVDGDGDQDLVALTKSALLIFTLGKGTTNFSTPATYRVAEENPQELRVADLNGDGRLDIAYVSESSDRALRVRFQHADSGFGPEFALPLMVGAADWQVMTANGAPWIATIKRTRSELQFSPASETTRAITRGRSFDIRSHPVPKSGVNPSLFTLGDFDGDGRQDVIVADTDGSSIYLYAQDATGEFRQPAEFPAPQGITSLSPLLRPGKGDALLLCSEKEGMVGLAEVNAAGRVSFPAKIAVPGEPMVAGTGDLDGDGTPEVIVATKDGKRFNLELLRSDGATFTAIDSVKLGSIKRSPTGIVVTDLDSDSKPDIVLFIPREPTRFLRQTDPLKFEEVGENDSVRTSQFEGVLPERFAVGDFTGAGKREMLVSGKGFVRAYRFAAAGGLEVVDQANGRSALDELFGPVLVDVDGDEKNELLAYHAESASFQVMARDAAGLFRYDYSIETGPIALVEAIVKDLGGAGGKRLVVFGKDRFWTIPLAPTSNAAAVARRSYRTDLKDVKYASLSVGDLDHDGRPDLLAVDPDQHILEILAGTPDGGFESAMFFRVFEENRFNRESRQQPVQPREVIIADVTGDGRDDVTLLCHDRVLLYPQRSPR